ncbi:hypothetical protein THASP1DRAFT_29003 [Thamnocephalis sphaerospora]|uniref:Tyrosinase copper-binding domain-containing protein n=1 Tax=Thamnocephalis sphaerospora TaxID=78915 RepID=A0A4P9XSV5_9FUNG|nr:hypothetical protein THASP1DRAFT_29003 [Thamnocephalis sphaerospora]|eukprot:RKP09206.1 hypothetical protein THASP1DRAFT_29003 [Thamnocephalis sphaerospora]
MFFPWHRIFLRRFERELQRIDPSIMLPYWDWSYDSQAPELSVVFRSGFYGGNGRQDDSCVVDGPFADWATVYPNTHCLQRKFDQQQRLSAFSGPEALRALQEQSRTYQEYRSRFESKPHAQVHIGIGSEFNTMYAVNDPIFWAHHAFVDKNWAEWQQMRPQNARAFDGTTIEGQSVSINDEIRPFGISVSEVMDTQNLCYRYADFAPARTVNAAGSNVMDILSQFIPASGGTNTTIVVHEGSPGEQEALPAAIDRKDLLKLRDTLPIPDDYIAAMGLDRKVVRETEELMSKYTMETNARQEYISAAAIINSPEKLASFASESNELIITQPKS